MDQAAKGKVALDSRKYDEAIAFYTEALKQAPTSPDYLIQRSTAFQRAGKHEEALADADAAVLAGQKRGKREAIVDAQFRRGIALYSLRRYGDAKFLLSKIDDMNKQVQARRSQDDAQNKKGTDVSIMGRVAAVKPRESMHHVWLNKTEMELKKLSEDDERRKVTITETPDQDAKPAMVENKAATSGASNGQTGSHANGMAASPASPASTATTTTVASAPGAQTPADKIRHEWYQNNDKVFFTLMVKGVPKDKAQVDMTERSLTISFPLATGSDYEFSLDPLFDAIKPDSSSVTITPFKLDLVLLKATPSVKWKTLEAPEGTEVPKPSEVRSFATVPAAPVYPTSSKSGPKDWDKVAKELRQPGSTDSDKTGAADDDDDDLGGDEANAFFKKLFKNASPEAQRAMMKSYTESNGTSLSTNWEEVSKGTVETVPPDGMEAKTWSK
jgi:suppressor of G2 allele of SKP1